MTISRSKYSICSKMNKKSGDDLYSLNSIIDKTNIDLLISNYELKLNDFNQLNVFKWTNDILYEFTLLFSLSWLTSSFIFSFKKMIIFSSQIDAHNCLVNDFIQFFQYLHQIFGNNFFKIKLIPMFDSVIKTQGISSFHRQFLFLISILRRRRKRRTLFVEYNNKGHFINLFCFHFVKSLQ